MELSKSSFLYSLLKLGRVVDRWTYELDTCTIFWGTLWSVFVFILASFVSALLIFLTLVSPIISIVTWFHYGYFDSQWYGFVGIMIDFMLCGVVGVFFALDTIRKRMENMEYRETEPGVLRQTYRAWKNKTCVNVNIVR